MKILALPKYSYEGASSRYRVYNYQKYFESQGLEVIIKPLFDKTYFTSRAKLSKLFVALKFYIHRLFIVSSLLISNKKYDLILLEYELFPFLPAIFERLFKLRGIKYIVDYDDAIFHKYDMSNNPIIKIFLKNKIGVVINNATYCLACNEYLESYIKQYNANILRLPTVVLLDNYRKAYESYNKTENDKFIVGWIGSKTTSVYILEMLDVFKALIDNYPNTAFNLVGFDENLVTQEQIDKYHLNIITWTEEDEIKNILDMDVGIMPLRNDPWSRGKCGFKLIQYMSCKKPVIASPVGINCSLVENGINGFLVESKDEWFNAFEELYLNQSLRVSMAHNNFEKILDKFNYDKNCQKYVNLIRALKND